MAKSTCRDCNRTVMMADLNGTPTALDPELIRVVAATERASVGRDLPLLAMAGRTTFARRLHAERCQGYQDQARRDRIAVEQRAYNEKNGKPPRKNRGL